MGHWAMRVFDLPVNHRTKAPSPHKSGVIDGFRLAECFIVEGYLQNYPILYCSILHPLGRFFKVSGFAMGRRMPIHTLLSVLSMTLHLGDLAELEDDRTEQLRILYSDTLLEMQRYSTWHSAPLSKS